MRLKATGKMWTRALSLVVAGVAMLFILPNWGYAESDRVKIDKIQPPPEFDFDERQISYILNRRFNDFGFIDSFNEERIVVGDVEYKMAPNASLSSVNEGNFVGVQLNDSGRVVGVERLQGPPE